MIFASSSKKLIVAILASCLVGLQMAPPSCAEEQKSEWQLHMDASLQALNSSDFKSAEQEIGVAEKLGLETPNDGRYALALLLHAQIYAKLERFADAEATIKKARENFTQSQIRHGTILIPALARASTTRLRRASSCSFE